MDEIGHRAEGFLEIQDGIYEIKEKSDASVRRGFVRQDYTIPQLEPKFTPSSNKKSFQVDISCLTYASVFDEGRLVETKDLIKKETTYRRVASKNYTKDIKNFVCKFSGLKHSSLLRKRIIALEKIHKTVSDQKFRFPI